MEEFAFSNQIGFVIIAAALSVALATAPVGLMVRFGATFSAVGGGLVALALATEEAINWIALQ